MSPLSPLAGPQCLGAQLPAELDDGAQVLHRCRETQLGDQLTASGERLEPETSADQQGGGSHRERDHDRQHVETALVDAPQCEAAGEVARAHPCESLRRIVPHPPGHEPLPGHDDASPGGWRASEALAVHDSGQRSTRTWTRRLRRTLRTQQPRRLVILPPRWRSTARALPRRRRARTRRTAGVARSGAA